MKYIHYGSNCFDPSKFVEIKNEKYFNKPRGELWASNIESEFGWKNWCEREEFCTYSLDNSFVFELSTNARVYEINTKEDIEKMPLQSEQFSTMLKAIDFEALSNDYDVIKFNYDKNPSLYWDLYGWDCDSILVLNKEVIV